jgi:dTDP-4-amino-4,6-dideoxygalactose transaminase
MGAITPILYQTAIPVFADVDPVTGNVTAASIKRVIGPKTRAIIVTHLFGYPADMEAICALAKEHGIPVIEDCAQAYGAMLDGRHLGTIGDIGCFSLQQGKHITTGEGGVVVTNSDAFARRIRLFIDKAWGYGDPKPDHYFAALNSRMTELQGAVALAQMEKLSFSISQRQIMAGRLTAAISNLAGIVAPPNTNSAVHSYWKYPIIVKPEVGGPDRFAKELRGFGIMSAPRYIQKPAFECAVIKDQRTFGDSRFPFSLARPEAVDYAPERFPGTYTFLRDVLVLPWNERYTNAHVDYLAQRIHAVCQETAVVDAAE